MKLKIMVLEAGNFIGSRLVAALHTSDWAAPIVFGGRTAQLSHADLCGVNAIANCTVGSANSILENARALYQAAGELAEPVRIVHLSSMTIYGSSHGEITESTAPLADLGAYAQAHIEAEHLANRCPDSVILRCGCEYGPGCPQWSDRIALLLRAHRLGDLGAAGDGVCNLVFVDDLVAAILAALRISGAKSQTFNLAMSRAPTWNEYFIRFGVALRAVPVSRITARRLVMEAKVFAPPLKLLEILTQKWSGRRSFRTPPITSSLIKLCRQEIILNSAKAVQILGITWTPLEDGLRRAAASWLANASEL